MIAQSEVFKDYLDLRGTPCPVNFIRCRLALKKLERQDVLKVDLDKGEPELMVVSGLRKAGHHVEIVMKEDTWLTLNVVNSGG